MLLNNFSSQLFLFSKGVSIRRNDRYLKGDLQRGQLSPEYPGGIDVGFDAMQPELVKPKRDHCPHGFFHVAVAPVVGVKGVADLCPGIGPVDLP